MKYSKGDLTKFLGQKYGYVNSYVNIGKLVEDENGMIDDSDELNKQWIESKRAKFGWWPDGKPKDKKVENVTPRSSPGSSADMAELDRKKKIAEIEYKNAQTETAKLKAQKLRGESIPTKLVNNVFKMLGHTFQQSYKNGANQLMIEIAQRTKMSPEDKAYFKGLLTSLINETHSKAITEAKKSIESIVDETSVKLANQNDDSDE